MNFLNDIALKLADFPENPTNDQILERALPLLKEAYIQGLQDAKVMYRNTWGPNFYTEIDTKIIKMKG